MMCVKEPVLRVKLLHVKSIRRKLLCLLTDKRVTREREKNTSQREEYYILESISIEEYITNGPRTEQSGESQALRVRKKSSRSPSFQREKN